MIQRLSDLLCDATSLAENVLDMLVSIAAVRKKGKGIDRGMGEQEKRDGTQEEEEDYY